MSKQAVYDLMTRLSQDRWETREFKRNPDRFLAELELTELERALLRRSDRVELRSYFGDDGPVVCIFMTCDRG